MSRALVLAVLAASALVTGCRRDDARSKAKPGAKAAPSVTARPAKHTEPLPPPPLTAPAPVPSLPPLPPLDGHPKPKAPPPHGPDVHGCGQVWSGSGWVPAACIDPAVYPQKAKMAKVVVPYALMKAPVEHLPAVVDHRADGTEGPMRRQRGPECTAFAFASAADHAYSRWTGKPGNFSVMQVWARYLRLNERGAANENVGQTLANESEWPYDANEANSWLRCPTGSDPRRACGKPVDRGRLTALDQRAVAEVTQVEVLSTSELDVLRHKLAAGQDATIAIALPSFATAGDPGSRFVVGYSQNGPAARPKIGHQVLLSGYARLTHGTYYLIHNSFGTGWGDDGYAWIHEKTMEAHWNDSRIYVVDVEPVQAARRKRRAQGGLAPPCPEGELPDSITSTCTHRCPDGSPRHAGVCPVANQCRAGQVNLTGECLMAAPKSAGTDPATHVRWSCGPGGCTYWVPQGQAGCTHAECSASCPAPDFRLATGPRGIVCVE